ncbi:hypothetical protein GCM10010394_70450 [Streptomyces crystallinus]|uniref:Uncharacterized protein n=1 Tax=Streptomyces crystallinus TaxID=68191 RepID=A0ABN1H4R5_9ACTN
MAEEERPERRRHLGRLEPAPTPTKESGTRVAYQCDVGPLGLGKPVSNAPRTFHGRTRPAPVLDTVDPLYIEHSPTGAQLTFSPPASDPSYLTVPLREE